MSTPRRVIGGPIENTFVATPHKYYEIAMSTLEAGLSRVEMSLPDSMPAVVGGTFGRLVYEKRYASFRMGHGRYFELCLIGTWLKPEEAGERLRRLYAKKP